MNTHVIGMDGCRAGWVICRLKVETLSIDLIAVASSLSDVLGRESAATHIAIDIPIGLPEMGSSRPCDLEARQRLTKLRSNSVFPAPARDLLKNTTYLEACARSRAVCGKGVSKQAHAIFPKVAEVDDIMTPELQHRVFEVHPELCFWGLAGERPMQNSKKYPKGYKERRNLLAGLLSTELPEREHVTKLGLPIEPDDLLDAIVAAYTAYRANRGAAVHIPANSQLDRKGLRMEMVY